MENTSSVKIYRDNNCTCTKVVMTVEIPFCNKQKEQDFDLDRAQKRVEAYTFDLIGSFAPRMIASLKRRMCACQDNLIRHFDDIEYSDEFGHIVYRRKDGSTGTFNVPSFNSMQEAVQALAQSRWREFKDNPLWIDQTLKALLNDTEQDHSDCGKLKYSDLVSFLCEAHISGFVNPDSLSF